MMLLGDELVVLKPLPAPPATQTLIVCSVTGTLVPTGVPADTLLDSGRVYVLVRCRACGLDHVWAPEAALVVALSMPML